jgi:hypothetical protein
VSDWLALVCGVAVIVGAACLLYLALALYPKKH